MEEKKITPDDNTQFINDDNNWNDKEKEKKFPCDRCKKVFLNKQARDLHMNNSHNIKIHQYTPGIAKRKVGHQATRHICEIYKIKMKTDNEIRNQMTTVHKHPKRTRSELKPEQI